jgi:hypothetical protein
MVERDPALHELLNGDVGNICGWLNFRNKSCVSLCLLHLLSAVCYVFFVFLSSIPRVFVFVSIIACYQFILAIPIARIPCARFSGVPLS